MENFRSLANANANDLHHQNPNIANMEINKPIKVKYISNPMMVKANNESEFRAIVQKLTGQHSPDHASNYDAKDGHGLLSGNVCDPVGVRGEVCDWGGEMEGSFSGFQASYKIDAWRST